MNDERGATIVSQPVHEYSTSFADLESPLSAFTHMGTDYGRRGPGAERMSWNKTGIPDTCRST